MHHFLEAREFAYGRAEFFHAVCFRLQGIRFQVARVVFLRFLFIDVFIARGQVGQVCIDPCFDEFRRPAFALHRAEQVFQVVDLVVYVAPVAFEGVAVGEAIDQLLVHLHAFQFGHGVQGGFLEGARIFLDHFVAEGVEGVDADLVGIRPDELEEPFAHGNDARVCIREAEDVFRACIRIQEDLADAAGQDLGFARAGTGDYHDRPFDMVDRFFLFFVQFLEFFEEAEAEFFFRGRHGVELFDW